MKTDDRTTRQGDEVEGDEAKVVRLSDWLAPDDELVPFGPRAYAQAATGDPSEGSADPHSGDEPTAASGFWDGDTSVHTAVPGPGVFDEPTEPGDDRRQAWRPAFIRRPALSPLHPFGWACHARERLADLVGWISWRWAAGVAIVAPALVVFVIAMSGSSSGHRDAAAQASLGGSSSATLSGSGTLDEIGTAGRAAAVSDLRRLPPVDVAVRTIGAARMRAASLQARRQRHAAVAVAASAPSLSTNGSVETPTGTAAPAPAVTNPAPAETEPVQTTSGSTPTGGGGSSSSGGASSGGGSSSGSQKHSTFGATGSLGPGSSPNG